MNLGDFLSYINHSYNDVEHSAIFVAWLDRERREALMLTYVGSNREVPGGYRAYDLGHVYRVIRGKSEHAARVVAPARRAKSKRPKARRARAKRRL